MKKYFIPFILLSVCIVALSYAVQNMTFWPRLIVTGLAGVALTYGVFALSKTFQPPLPRNLSLGDVKSYFQSKIFWLAFANLVSAMMDGLFDIQMTQGDLEAIVNLDWTNILRAGGSVLAMVIRRFDPMKLLK